MKKLLVLFLIFSILISFPIEVSAEEGYTSSISAVYGEYPTADYIWQFLLREGFSKESAAGIIGNMMSECGGHTLNLRYNAINPSGYYGLCQWSRRYCGQIWGASLETQMNYLVSSMQNSFNYFSGGTMSVSKFKKIKDPATAAIYFAEYYEVCGSAGYYQRGQNARSAYNYYWYRKN